MIYPRDQSISMNTINTPEPVKPPSNSFSSTNSQHDIQTPLKAVTEKNSCRSVKSIVAWLESSTNNQQWSPRSNAANMAHDLSAGSVSTCHDLPSYNHSASGASEVEDYSLTYLKYKEYFTSAPVVRYLAPEGRSSTEHRKTNTLVIKELPRPSAPDVTTATNNGSGHTREGSGFTGGDEVSFVERDPEAVKAF